MGINAYNTTKYTPAEIQSLWRANITSSIKQIETIQKNIQYESIDISLSPSHKALLTSDVVAMTYLSGSVTKFDLNEATKQIISKSFNILNLPLSSITTTNADVYFLVYNIFNEYYLKLVQSSEFFLAEYTTRCDDGKTAF
jgi:hypothetical protein